MPIKFLDEFYSVNGIAYKIAIDDDTLVSDSNFTFSMFNSSIFNLSYSGESQKRFNPVLPSKVTFQMVIQDTTGEDFIEDLINSVDGRFKLRIEKYSKLNLVYELYWVGTIVTDQVSYEDASYPFAFNITAVDGLSLLARKDYNNAGLVYSGDATLLEHIQNCLDKTDLAYFYGVGDNFLQTIVNWYDDNQSYDAVNKLDPLVNTRLNHRAFYQVNDEGFNNYKNCLEVLKEIATVFGARIYQSNGAIRFEQVNEMVNASYYRWDYNSSFTELSKGNITSDNLTIDQTVLKTQLAGGTFAFLAGLQYVKLSYYHYANQNLLYGTSWNSDLNENLVIGDILSNTTSTVLSFATTLYIKILLVTSSTDLWRFDFKLKIKHGTKWLKREVVDNGDGVLIINPATWEDVESYYIVSTEWLPTGTIIENIDINFQTPVLPLTNGVLEFDFNYNDVYMRPPTFTGTSGSPYVGPPAPDVTVDFWKLITPTVELFEDGEGNMEELRVYQVNNDFYQGNTETLDLVSYVGDAVTDSSRGKLEIYNGTDWQNSELWSINQAGSGYIIGKLMIYEILAGQKRGTMTYNGSFQLSLYHAHTRLTYDSNLLVLINGSFDAGNDVWNGTWFKLALSRNNMTFSADTTGGGSNTTGGGFGGGSSPGGNTIPVSFIPPEPEFFSNVSGQSITGLTGTLPPNSLADQYLEVFRDGRKLRHTVDYTIDEGNNEIDLVLQAMGEGFEIKIY